MPKESSFQIFPINIFVKKAYHAVKFLHKYTDCVGITGYWSKIVFIISLKENIVFLKFLETYFGSNILA